MTQRKLAQVLEKNLDVSITLESTGYPKAKCKICTQECGQCSRMSEQCTEGIREWLIEKNKGGKE